MRYFLKKNNNCFPIQHNLPAQTDQQQINSTKQSNYVPGSPATSWPPMLPVGAVYTHVTSWPSVLPVGAVFNNNFLIRGCAKHKEIIQLFYLLNNKYACVRFVIALQ